MFESKMVNCLYGIVVQWYLAARFIVKEKDSTAALYASPPPLLVNISSSFLSRSPPGVSSRIPSQKVVRWHSSPTQLCVHPSILGRRKHTPGSKGPCRRRPHVHDGPLLPRSCGHGHPSQPRILHGAARHTRKKRPSMHSIIGYTTCPEGNSALVFTQAGHDPRHRRRRRWQRLTPLIAIIIIARTQLSTKRACRMTSSAMASSIFSQYRSRWSVSEGLRRRDEGARER